MKYVTALGSGFFMLGFTLGIPLLGWGITEWEAFFSNPARLLYGVSAGLWALLASVGLLLLRFPYTPGKREGDTGKLVTRQNRVPALARLIWLAIFIVSPYGDRHHVAVLDGVESIRYVGLLMFILGLAWVVWAFLTLGKQHSGAVTIQADHQLVTAGPYRWLRHPMYLGLIAFPWGVGLVFRSWVGMALPLLLMGLFVWRIRDEEQLMRREFGERWDTYCQHTWRLIPYVY